MAIRGVIFDLFHTLTSPESGWSDLPWTSDILGIDRSVWNGLLSKHSRWRLVGDVRDPTEIVRLLVKDIHPIISEELIAKASSFRLDRFRQALENIPPENLELLSELRFRGLRLGLLSNADASEVAAWPSSPLAGRFDTEIFSCNVGTAKPEAAIYVECLRQLGLAANECVFVGDGGSDELVGARKVGMHSVFFSGAIEAQWPERIATRAADADAHIRVLSHLLSLPIFIGGNSPPPAGVSNDVA